MIKGWGKTQGERMYETAIRQETWDMWFRRVRWLLAIAGLAALIKYLVT